MDYDNGMDAFPFMWTKNRYISEWQCVAKPEFLMNLEGRLAGMLLEAQHGGGIMSPDQIIRTQCFDPKGGFYDVIYRHVQDGAKDMSGRPVYRVEGFVTHGRAEIPLTHKHFDTAMKRIEPIHKKFMGAKSWSELESLHSEKTLLQPLPAEKPLQIRDSVSTRMPPPATTAAPTASPTASAGTAKAATGWADKLKSGLSTPKGKAIAFGVGAAVIIGGVMIARHFAQKREAEQQPAVPTR